MSAAQNPSKTRKKDQLSAFGWFKMFFQQGNIQTCAVWGENKPRASKGVSGIGRSVYAGKQCRSGEQWRARVGKLCLNCDQGWMPLPSVLWHANAPVQIAPGPPDSPAHCMQLQVLAVSAAVLWSPEHKTCWASEHLLSACVICSSAGVPWKWIQGSKECLDTGVHCSDVNSSQCSHSM